MTRRTCPVCPRRYAGLVDADCPVCQGVGVLALGAAALYRADAAAVARAVEFYLEAATREAAGQYPPGELRRDCLALAADRLRVAGLIGDPIGVADPEDHHDDTEGPARRIADYEAARLVAEVGGEVRPQDRANLDAEQVLYGPDDRPRAAGLLPRVSADGWPSQAAMAADPVDALGPSTRAQVYARQTKDRAATVLVAAVDRAVGIKARRTARHA